jgi:NAD(P)-dependent dehydrogenase (short-subunit alcohol dehydrogenase family)
MLTLPRTALIVGGSGGIGAAVARRLAGAGARVFLVGRDLTRLEQRAHELRGQTVAFAAADASRSTEMLRAVERCARELGDPDILVNAAGVHGPIGPFRTLSADEWWRAVEVNLRGTANACSAVVEGMAGRGWGRIINFSGGGATAPRPAFSAYASAKAAIVRFTETLAEELRGTGVTVNAIAPGMVDTPLHDSILAAGEAAGADYAETRKMRSGTGAAVSAEPAAQLTAWLASDEAAWLSGKLVSAVHDPWREWGRTEVAELSGRPWLTLRRLDAHTIASLSRGQSA